jgi:hypothetical protein
MEDVYDGGGNDLVDVYGSGGSIYGGCIWQWRKYMVVMICERCEYAAAA